MVFDREALRREAAEVARAGVHVEHTLALTALEVMMVVVPHRLEARVLAGQVHHLQLACLHQHLEVAVDRGDTQSRHGVLGCYQHLLRKKRAVGLGDGVAYRAALTGVAFHVARLPDSPDPE
jgi:hypothetical protein